MWEAQNHALASKESVEIDDHNMQIDHSKATRSARKQWQIEETERRGQMGGNSGNSGRFSRAASPASSWNIGAGGPMSPAQGSQDGSRGISRGKTLFIKRRVRWNLLSV